MRRLPILFLGALLVLAGCTVGPFGGPSPQEEPVTVVVNNSANVTHTFEVSVVERPANVTVRRDDGLSGTTDIGQGLVTDHPGDNHTYTAVELPDSARLHGRFTVSPGEQNRSVIKDVPPDFAVVAVVYQNENKIISYATANCDDLALIGFGVTSRPDSDSPGRISASYQCV